MARSSRTFGHDHFVPELLQLLADPDRVNDHFTALVESAVMAPDIAKVDANRHLHHGLSAWDFRDEVLRWLLQYNSLPSRATCSSHLAVLTAASRFQKER
jgi:hypothetical protein